MESWRRFAWRGKLSHMNAQTSRSIRSVATVAAFVLGCQLAGILGAIFVSDAIPTWYAGLAKPFLNPPSWVFGPVWTILYAMMGIAAFLVWKQGWKKTTVRTALSLFGIQLVLNAAWSILFFGMRNPAIALVDIAMLWISIVLTIALFSKVSRPAAWMLVPYLCWVSFATYLNAAIWWLN